MWASYGDAVEFLIVYIREAHAIDSRSPMSFGMVEDPITLAERSGVASQCLAELDLSIPALMNYPNPLTGANETVEVTYDLVALMVRLLMYAPETAALLPVTIHQAAVVERPVPSSTRASRRPERTGANEIWAAVSARDSPSKSSFQPS